MNIQPIEKRTSDPTSLSVHSIFHTIQGEGPFCGTPAVFIRLAGCNLQCPGCDTNYTTGRKDMYPIEIVDEVERLSGTTTLVVITGGEPFRQDISRLLKLLYDSGYYIQIETNGTLPPPMATDLDGLWSVATDYRTGIYIVASPKAGKVHELIGKLACAFKYVLQADSVADDGLPVLALQHSAHPQVARPPAHWRRPVYLQPMDEQDPAKNHRNLEAVIRSCMKHGYILQLQVHKIIDME